MPLEFSETSDELLQRRPDFWSTYPDAISWQACGKRSECRRRRRPYGSRGRSRSKIRLILRVYPYPEPGLNFSNPNYEPLPESHKKQQEFSCQLRHGVAAKSRYTILRWYRGTSEKGNILFEGGESNWGGEKYLTRKREVEEERRDIKGEGNFERYWTWWEGEDIFWAGCGIGSEHG